MSHDIELHDGAILVSDAHYNVNRRCFLHFVEYLDSLKVPPPQILMMGDMFDLLVGEVTNTKNFNLAPIEHINSLSLKSEIFYFEGNHDFNVSLVFENIKVFTMNLQPINVIVNGKSVLLSHGDYKVGGSYAIYSAIIRNHAFLKLLNFLDEKVSGLVSSFIIEKHLNKKLCRKFNNFETDVANSLNRDFDYCIEGHYHQDIEYKFQDTTYINLPAFACNQSYITVDSQNRNNLFSKVKYKDHRCRTVMTH